MKYLVLDLETTGLDWEHDQILEVGMVVDDFRITDRGLAGLPFFHCYVAHDHIHGNPVALAMNADIIKRIADHKRGMKSEERFVPPSKLYEVMCDFLANNFPAAKPDDKIRIQLAGKNVDFDKLFLRKVGNKVHMSGLVLNFGKFGFVSRALDPGPLFTVPGADEIVPSMVECCDRAGIPVDGEHTALGDCMTIVKLLRYYYADPVRATSVAFHKAMEKALLKPLEARKTKLL